MMRERGTGVSGQFLARETGVKKSKPAMEKRRRARINASLAELRSLIPDSVKRNNRRYSKMEKADILEMAVQYLRHLQESNREKGHISKTSYSLGFSECTQEVSQFFRSRSPFTTHLKGTLLEHLNGCAPHNPPDSPSASPTNTGSLPRRPNSSFFKASSIIAQCLLSTSTLGNSTPRRSSRRERNINTPAAVSSTSDDVGNDACIGGPATTTEDAIVEVRPEVSVSLQPPVPVSVQQSVEVSTAQRSDVMMVRRDLMKVFNNPSNVDQGLTVNQNNSTSSRGCAPSSEDHSSTNANDSNGGACGNEDEHRISQTSNNINIPSSNVSTLTSSSRVTTTVEMSFSAPREPTETLVIPRETVQNEERTEPAQIKVVQNETVLTKHAHSTEQCQSTTSSQHSENLSQIHNKNDYSDDSSNSVQQDSSSETVTLKAELSHGISSIQTHGKQITDSDLHNIAGLVKAQSPATSDNATVALADMNKIVTSTANKKSRSSFLIPIYVQTSFGEGEIPTFQQAFVINTPNKAVKTSVTVTPPVPTVLPAENTFKKTHNEQGDNPNDSCDDSTASQAFQPSLSKNTEVKLIPLQTPKDGSICLHTNSSSSIFRTQDKAENHFSLDSSKMKTDNSDKAFCNLRNNMNSERNTNRINANDEKVDSVLSGSQKILIANDLFVVDRQQENQDLSSTKQFKDATQDVIFLNQPDLSQLDKPKVVSHRQILATRFRPIAPKIERSCNLHDNDSSIEDLSLHLPQNPSIPAFPKVNQIINDQYYNGNHEDSSIYQSYSRKRGFKVDKGPTWPTRTQQEIVASDPDDWDGDILTTALKSKGPLNRSLLAARRRTSTMSCQSKNVENGCKCCNALKSNLHFVSKTSLPGQNVDCREEKISARILQCSNLLEISDTFGKSASFYQERTSSNSAYKAGQNPAKSCSSPVYLLDLSKCQQYNDNITSPPSKKSTTTSAWAIKEPAGNMSGFWNHALEMEHDSTSPENKLACENLDSPKPLNLSKRCTEDHVWRQRGPQLSTDCADLNTASSPLCTVNENEFIVQSEHSHFKDCSFPTRFEPGGDHVVSELYTAATFPDNLQAAHLRPNTEVTISRPQFQSSCLAPSKAQNKLCRPVCTSNANYDDTWLLSESNDTVTSDNTEHSTETSAHQTLRLTSLTPAKVALMHKNPEREYFSVQSRTSGDAYVRMRNWSTMPTGMSSLSFSSSGSAGPFDNMDDDVWRPW